MHHDRKYHLEARIARLPPPPRQRIIALVFIVSMLTAAMVTGTILWLIFNP